MPLDALASGKRLSYSDEVKHVRPMQMWYEALADFIIANPTATGAETAAYLRRAESTISIVKNSDSFKAYFRKRRDEHAERLDAAVRAKLFSVADKSLDHLLTAMDKKRDSIPIEVLQRTSDMALKNLGYSAQNSGPTVTVNTAPQTVNVAVSLQDLEAAREALRRNQMRTIDASTPLGGSGDHSTPDPKDLKDPDSKGP